MVQNRLVIYTTVYPGVKPYLKECFDSIQNQTDMGFDLFIGSDGLTKSEVFSVVENEFKASWYFSKPGETPSEIRSNALSQVLDDYKAVILVDSDDILFPTRVEYARQYISNSDVNVCPLELVDSRGNRKGISSWNKPEVVNKNPLRFILTKNIFGFSNTTYKTDLLRQILPIHKKAKAADWYLITKAILKKAKISYDIQSRMYYRQHGNNIAPIVSPFNAKQILNASTIILNHYEVMLEDLDNNHIVIKTKIKIQKERVHRFLSSLESSEEIMNHYLEYLNSNKIVHPWWNFVAHPELEEIWK